MSRILIFAGTTEGRELAMLLADNGIDCDVSVATEYGNMVLPESERVTVHEGRLSFDAMKELYQKAGCEMIVDATHPFAKAVTETIRMSASECRIPVYRLLRSASGQYEGDYLEYGSVEECAKALRNTEGNILLTTGSKELSVFTGDKELQKRLVVRVLPGKESLNLCLENGLEGKQIICMQGPFSEEMNLATMRQYQIAQMVTKDSGRIGGVDSKICAAVKAGVRIHMIKRPKEQSENVYSMEELCSLLEEKLSVAIHRSKTEIILAGIGCGDSGQMTEAVRKAVLNADYVFGAKRMLESIAFSGMAIPYYTKEKILPELERIEQEGASKIVILFSGDTGFYSGAAALYDALKNRESCRVSVLPGISSIVYFAAKLGISWQDAEILSTHGVDRKEWEQKLLQHVRYRKKTFFITSGIQDINRIGTLLSESDCLMGDDRFYVGQDLSYRSEKIRELRAEEAKELQGEGLYVGVIIRKEPERRPLYPVIRDLAFLREKVPMTKEEIRALSIRELRLCEQDVFYDIGSGTGSISVEAACLSDTIRVYSLECREEAAALTLRNKERFGLENIMMIRKKAPDGLQELPPADAAFLGGSRGQMEEILLCLREKNPKMRVVINAVTLESIAEMTAILKKMEVKNLKMIQVGVTGIREVGNYHMMDAANPVMIASFSFTE